MVAWPVKDSFWAKVAGSHYGSPWHLFVENAHGAMVPRCGHKLASGPPSRKHMHTQPKMGHLCKFCAEEAQNGSTTMRSFETSAHAVKLFQEGKLLREISEEIGRSISTVKTILYKECRKRGLDYDFFIEQNRLRRLKEAQPNAPPVQLLPANQS